jgi:hypothetical protein
MPSKDCGGNKPLLPPDFREQNSANNEQSSPKFLSVKKAVSMAIYRAENDTKIRI